jgi:hypothetical protein
MKKGKRRKAMQNIPLYTPDNLPRLGETRIEDGQLAMCINPFTSYACGSGDLWAVENKVAQFTVKEHRGYLEGICRKVEPRNKIVTIEITKGATWGRLMSGSIVKFSVADIIRYHPASDAGEQLIFQSQKLRSEIWAKEVFIERSIADLERALANEYQEQLAKVLGEAEHAAMRELISAYLIASQEINKSMGHCLHMPSRALKQAKQKLHEAFDSYVKAKTTEQKDNACQ